MPPLNARSISSSLPVLLVLNLVIPDGLAQPIPNSLVAVPPALVKGRTLSVPDLNFSIDAPEGWRWLMQEQVGPFHMYIAQDRTVDIRHSLTVITAPEVLHLGQDEAERFLKQFMTQRSSRGWTIVRSSCTPSRNQPAPSYACSVDAKLPDGDGIYGFFDLTARDTRMYVMSVFTADDSEPPLFTHFVESLRFHQ